MAIVLMVGSLSTALHLAVQSSILPLRLPQLSFNYACAADQLRSDERILSAPTFASNARSTSLGGVVDRQRVGGQQAVSAAVTLGRRARASRCRTSSDVRMNMMPPEEIECDVVIVGGGPAGCTCALYTARANLKTVLLDKNPATGALAITSHIANYPGVDKTMGGDELLEKMRDQAIEYGTDYRRAQVFLVDADPDSDRKSVYTPDATIHARCMVLATGAMGRPPTYKGEGELLGKGVSYCATCDAAFYQDSEVAVVGTNLEAIEEAEFLTKFAKKVHWVTATDPKMDDPHAQALLACDNVQHWSKTKLESVEGETGVTGVKLRKKGDDAEEVFLEVEGVFIYVAGSKPITDFLDGSSVALNDGGGVKVDEDMETNVPGVFAIGDIRNTPYKQVVVAASDGCIAAMSAEKFLKGRKSVRVDWVHQ